MIETVLKRDGTKEEFSPTKLNKWGKWAAENIEGIDWGTVVLDTVKSCKSEISSHDLQTKLIESCLDRQTWNYNLMAGRLQVAQTRKKLYGDAIPTVRKLHKKLSKLGLMRVLNYTDDEYDEIDTFIDHSRDFNMAHFQLEYILHKYSIQNKTSNKHYETPQFVYMRMAMALAEDEPNDTRMMHLRNWYNHFSFNRINAPTPNYTNLGTPHYGLASCFPAGTEVDVCGGTKMIEDISIGDNVIGMSGKVRKVSGITNRHFQGDLISFKSPIIFNHDTRATQDHLYYVKRNGINQWIPANEIIKGDYLYHPIQDDNFEIVKVWELIGTELESYGYSCVDDIIGKINVCDNPGDFNKSINTVKNINIKNNEDFYRLAGYYLAEGHASINEKKRSGYVGFTFNHNDTTYIEDVIHIFKNLFDVEVNIRDDSDLDSCIRLSVHSLTLSKLFVKLCGKGAAGKGDLCNFLITSSKNAISNCISGYIRGDGCAVKTGYVASSISKSLILFVRDSALSLGYPASVNEVFRSKDAGYGNAKKSYSVRITLQPDSVLSIMINKNLHKMQYRTGGIDYTIFEEGGAFSRVRGIERFSFSGTVYDFEVEDDHSFTVGGVCVHNCCLYTTDDNAQSLSIGDHIAYTQTYMSAGIGANIQCRGLGDSVKNGMIKHQGKLPYYRSLAGAIKANMQGGRGGACTVFYSCFDPEVITITMLQNPRTPVDKQNRDLHFSILTNRLFAKKVAKNEDIFTFTIHSAPDLHNLFYSEKQDEFEALYKEYEENPKFKKNYISARKILLTAGQQSYDVATLYYTIIDEVNRHTPFKETIYQSNLCVAPEVKILTDFGYATISDLKDKTVNVWNGEEFSEVIVRKTSDRSKLITVITDSGHDLPCTPEHKFYIQPHDSELSIQEVMAKDLKPGMKLIKHDLPVIQGRFNPIDAHERGVHSACGAFNDKIFVPNCIYTIDYRLNWLTILYEANGYIDNDGTNQQLVYPSGNFEFLRELSLMLQTLGIQSKIKKDDDVEKLIISGAGLIQLIKLRIVFSQMAFDEKIFQNDVNHFVEIVDVVDNDRYDETYCFTEPKRHMGMFNGILTGQCLEILEPTSPYSNMMDLYSGEDVSSIKFISDSGEEIELSDTCRVKTTRGVISPMELCEGDEILEIIDCTTSQTDLL